MQEEDVGKYVAPEQQEAHRGSGIGGSASVARRQGQYDADTGRADAAAETFAVGPSASASGDGGAGTASRGPASSDAAAGASAVNRQSSQRGDARGRLWAGTSSGAVHADEQAAAPAGPGSGHPEQQPEAGFQHFSMREHKHGGQRGKQGAGEAAACADDMSPGRQVSRLALFAAQGLC